MNVAFIAQTNEAAGLLRAYGPLKAIQEKHGWNVKLWPSKTYRGRDYIFLNRYHPLEGQHTVGMHPDRDYMVFDQNTFPNERVDLLVLHQPLNDHRQMVAWVRAQGGKVVVDCDDDYLNFPHHHPAREGLKNRAFGHEVKNLEWLIRDADAVTVSTPALADTYAHWNPNITVIRNGLWWPMWETLNPVERDYRSIGYVGTLNYREDDLRLLQGVIGPWLRRHPDWRFVSIGNLPEDARSVPKFLDVPEEQAVYLPWHDYGPDWCDVVGMIDVGLVPLYPNRFNEAKSHLKGMEHNAAGRVFIASPSESYQWWQGDDAQAGGAMAKRARDWTRWLDYFADMPAEEFQWEGDMGREHAHANQIGERVDEWYNAWMAAVNTNREEVA